MQIIRAKTAGFCFGVDRAVSHRAVAPLKQAADAILVDTSDIGLQESFDLLKHTILAHI